MAVINTNNFNFQGIGFPANILIPQPPINYVPPKVHIVTNTFDINGDVSNRCVRVTFDDTPSANVRPSTFYGTVEVPILNEDGIEIVQVTSYGDQFNPIEYYDYPGDIFTFGGQGVIGNLFDDQGNTYYEGDVTVIITFNWENSSGNIVHTENVEQTLQLVLGCTDSTANNWDELANINNGSCSYLN